MNTDQPFHEVVEQHGPSVLRVCAATLGPGADSEDAWAETFVAALAAFPFTGLDNVEAWLVRVARNKCIDVLRARSRSVVTDPVALADDAAPAVALSHGPTVGGVAPPVESWDDELWGHVAALSERQQFVVVHRYVGQWTYPEIAEKLGCSPAAARRCGADAIAALRGRVRPGTTPTPAPAAPTTASGPAADRAPRAMPGSGDDDPPPAGALHPTPRETRDARGGTR